MDVMSTRARPQAVAREIQGRIFWAGAEFKSNFRLSEAHLSCRVLTSTFRRCPSGNRSRKRWAPAAGRGKAGPDTPGFLLWPWADEGLQGFSFCRRNVHTQERPPERPVSSTPPRYSCDRALLVPCATHPQRQAARLTFGKKAAISSRFPCYGHYLLERSGISTLQLGQILRDTASGERAAPGPGSPV